MMPFIKSYPYTKVNFFSVKGKVPKFVHGAKNKFSYFISSKTSKTNSHSRIFTNKQIGNVKNRENIIKVRIRKPEIIIV